MAGFVIKDFETLVSDMATWVVSHSSQISDLTPGSVIRSICEGAALCLEEVYVSTYLGFRRQLETIQQTIYDFPRKTGVKASADVVFGRTGTTGDITIPIGTRIKTASGLRFLTTQEGTIADGDTASDPVEAEAEETGTAYNVAATSINVMEDTIDDVETVSNANAAVGGINEESDYEYKKRFQAYIEGLGRSNKAGLIAGAMSVAGITSASVVELFPPVANVNAKLYVDDGSSGGVGAPKVAEVQAIIDGDGTEDNPGYRACGVNVVVVAPTVVTQNITVSVAILAGSDSEQIKSDVNLALTGYVNTLAIGADIIHAELVTAVMGVYGVTDCSVSVPSANVTITDSQVGRVGTISITVV